MSTPAPEVHQTSSSLREQPSRQVSTERDWFWRMLHGPLWLFIRPWLQFQVRGQEHIPASGGGLLVSNHQSFVDPILLGLYLDRPLRMLARDSLHRVPILGWIVTRLHTIPISREATSPATIKESIRAAEQGHIVGIFPEGTRQEQNAVGEFKPGFIALVRRGKFPIYPVGIAGANYAMPRGAWFPRPRKVRLVYGPPLSPAEIAPLCERGREEELVALIRERVVACHGEAEAWRRE